MSIGEGRVWVAASQLWSSYLQYDSEAFKNMLAHDASYKHIRTKQEVFGKENVVKLLDDNFFNNTSDMKSFHTVIKIKGMKATLICKDGTQLVHKGNKEKLYRYFDKNHIEFTEQNGQLLVKRIVEESIRKRVHRQAL